MTAPSPRIGFIGIGLMGHGMARNLLAKGFPLTLKLNRDRSRLPDLLAAGAREVSSAAELATVSDIIILCVTGSPQVEALLLGEQGIAQGARPGLVVIDTSTAEPQSTTRLREALAPRGITLVDAPLTRTPVEAEAGRLNSLVGAEPQVLEQIRPVLAAYSENIFHVGPPGAGHTLKLINNFLALAIAACTAEAFAVGARAGVNLEKLVEVVSAGAVNSGIFQLIAGGTINGDLTRMIFALDNAAKDMRYFTHLAESLPVPAHIGEAVHQAYVQAQALGLGDRYVASLMTAQERLNGVTITPR